MTKPVKYIGVLSFFLLIFGCAGLEPGFEKPTVGLSSFRFLPSQGVAPRFEIGLHIVNPNRIPLKLRGVVYSVTLDGHRVLTGVSNDLPEVAAYGEADVVLTATADLLRSVSLLSALVKQPRDAVDYQLDATLDIGGLMPRIHLQETGQISLGKGTL